MSNILQCTTFQDTRKYIYQYFAVIVVTSCMLADGMQFAWSSPAVPKLLAADSPILMTKEKSNWVSQCYLMGNISGVLLSIIIFNKTSRKLAIFLSCVPILIGWIGNLFARSLIVLLTTRFIGGVGKNMAYVSVPVYIGEIAHPKIRGVLGTCIYVMMNVGVLIVYTITPFTSLTISSSVGVIIAFSTSILVKFIPESPYYLLIQNNPEGAKKSLQKLRNTNAVEEELQTLSMTVKRQTQDKPQFSKLFTIKSNRKALYMLLVLRFAQVYSGITVITMHSHMIFSEAGGISSDIAALVFAAMMLLSSFISMCIMDRFRRKQLMLFSCIFSAITLATQGSFFFLKAKGGLDTSTLSWFPLANTVLFVFFYKLGLGTIPIVMVSEFFPANVKVSGVVMANLMWSVSSLTSVTLFQLTEDTLGMYVSFWIFSGVCVISAIFSHLVLPETKGITLEDIQLKFMKKSPEQI